MSTRPCVPVGICESIKAQYCNETYSSISKLLIAIANGSLVLVSYIQLHQLQSELQYWKDECTKLMKPELETSTMFHLDPQNTEPLCTLLDKEDTESPPSSSELTTAEIEEIFAAEVPVDTEFTLNLSESEINALFDTEPTTTSDHTTSVNQCGFESLPEVNSTHPMNEGDVYGSVETSISTAVSGLNTFATQHPSTELQSMSSSTSKRKVIRKKFDDLKTPSHKRIRMDEHLKKLEATTLLEQGTSLEKVLLTWAERNQQKFNVLLKSIDNGRLFNKLVNEWKQQGKEEFLKSLKCSTDETLLTKDETNLSDTNYSKLRSGLHLEDVLCSIGKVKERRKYWNDRIRRFLKFECTEVGDGTQVKLKTILPFILQQYTSIVSQQIPQKIQLKITLDGRPFAGRNQLLIGIVPLNVNTAKIQSEKNTFPLIIVDAEEKEQEIIKVCKKLTEEIKELHAHGFKWKDQTHPVEFYLCADLAALWMLTRTS